MDDLELWKILAMALAGACVAAMLFLLIILSGAV